MNFLRNKNGFAHVGILVLLLAVGVLVATVYVAKSGTDLGSFAAQSGPQTYVGEVKKLSTCIQRGVCHELVNTADGKSHYLLAQSDILGRKINLDDWVGKRVSASGIEWLRKSISYLVVSKISKEKAVSLTSLNVTEFGVVQKVMLLPTVPIPGGQPVGEPVDEPVAAPAGMTCKTNDDCIVGPKCTPGKPCSSRPNINYGPCDNGFCQRGKSGFSPPATGSKCVVRPACLDDKKHPCRVAMPENGWCPPAPPTCLVRPACLDANPPCNVSPLPPGKTYCPPTPVMEPQYQLHTSDGRNYPLINMTGGSPCPAGAKCTEIMKDRTDFEQFVGKSVFVEGAMNMAKTSKYCQEIYPVPAGCGGTSPMSWWPLPGGLTFEVKKIQEARLTDSGKQMLGTLSEATGAYDGENLFSFDGGSEKVVARSSFFDLSKYLGKGEVTISVDRYSVGVNNNPIINIATIRCPTVANCDTKANKISWTTDSGDVTLSADNFYIDTGYETFYGDPGSLQLHSDPPDPASLDYTTLEATWKERGVEMRLFMYFNKDKNNWWSKEIRTYNGAATPAWVYYDGNFFNTPVGQTFSAPALTLKATKSDAERGVWSQVYFKNLKLKAFAKSGGVSPSRPPTLGNSCTTNHDCQNFNCRAPLNCTQIMSSLRCLHNICSMGDADL